MARSNIDVIITVKDGASKPLDDVQKKTKDTGKAFREASADIWQFNKTIFSTMAFVGLFSKAIGAIKGSLDFGAPLERVEAQFERIMGPKGDLLKSFAQATNSIVDEQSLLTAGLKLGELGLVKNNEQLASLTAQMAVAGRMAGKTATEGVSELSEAFASININALEHFNLLQKSNPALLAQFQILNKSGGILGNALVKQQQFAMMQRILFEHTKDYMFMTMSTGEVVEGFGTSFKNLRQSIGIFLATALRPLLEKAITLFTRLHFIVDELRRSDKQILFLVKSVLALTAGFTGLFATLGSLKLLVKLLASAGIGIPGLTAAVLGLGLSFLGITKNATNLIDKLKVIGAVFKGIYELVTNLDPETGMSKISESTKKLLEEHGLLGFVKTISRIVVAIKTALTDVYKAFLYVGNQINNVFGGMFDKFKNVFSNFTSDWTTWWSSDALSPIEKFARAAISLLGPVLGFFGVKGLKWGMGKIAGGLFGGTNDGSSPTKALWIKSVDGVKSLVSGAGGFLLKTIEKTGGKGAAIADLIEMFGQSLAQGGLLTALKDIPTLLGLFGEKFAVFSGVFGQIEAIFSELLAPLAVLGAALGGAIEGIVDTSEDWGRFFTGILDIGSAIKNAAVEIVKSSPFLTAFFDSVSWIASKIWEIGKLILVDGPMKVLQLIAEGWRGIFGLLGSGAGKLGELMSEWAKNKNMEVASHARKREFSDFISGKSQSLVTDMPSNEKDMINILMDKMSQLDDSSRAQMVSALQEALSSKETNGRSLSDEEYIMLLSKATKKGMEEAGTLKSIVENTKMKTTKGLPRQ